MCNRDFVLLARARRRGSGALSGDNCHNLKSHRAKESHLARLSFQHRDAVNVKGLEFQLDLGPGFLRGSLLAWETLLCALILSLAWRSETESAKSSYVLATPWVKGWASVSSLSVSDACVEPALVLRKFS